MGPRDDFERLREMGEERREGLKGFVSYSDLDASGSKDTKVPIKVVDLPELKYDRLDMGGIGQGKSGTPDVGQPLGQPEPDDGGGEDGDPGEEGVGHEYYEMDPEQPVEALDEELGLELGLKGKEIVEKVEGDFTNITRSGPHSTLDFERLFKEGLKRKLAMDFDEEFVREAVKIEGTTAREAFKWCRENNTLVSMAWVEDEWNHIPDDKRGAWASFTEMEENVERTTAIQRIHREGPREIPLRRRDERYHHPKVIKEKQSNVVVVNIHDVSGLMRETKRELVERTFTPLDRYLTGKYNHVEFVYIACDAEAWKVEHDEFSGIRSGGEARVSSAYKLAKEVLDERYPWCEQNRYVFVADSLENSSNDTKERVAPLMWEMDANLHAYMETQSGGVAINATHAEEVKRSLGEQGNVVVAYISESGSVIDTVHIILSTEATAE